MDELILHALNVVHNIMATVSILKGNSIYYYYYMLTGVLVQNMTPLMYEQISILLSANTDFNLITKFFFVGNK